MFVLLFLHLTPAHAGSCVGKGGVLGPPRGSRPWAPVRWPHPRRPPEEAARSCEGGRGRPPRASFAVDAAGRCAETARGWLLPAWRARGHSKDLQRPPQPTLGTGSSTSFVRESRRPAGGRPRHSAHTPAAQGTWAVLPRPPKRSRLFVCLGDFRKRRAGLSGYWYCFFAP